MPKKRKKLPPAKYNKKEEDIFLLASASLERQQQGEGIGPTRRQAECYYSLYHCTHMSKFNWVKYITCLFKLQTEFTIVIIGCVVNYSGHVLIINELHGHTP